jgi:hypothetical protein
VWIVLPAYNEQQRRALLDAIQDGAEPSGIHYAVIVVDDGSRTAPGVAKGRLPHAGRFSDHGVNQVWRPRAPD